MARSKPVLVLIAACLAAPALLFVLVNVLRSTGIEAPYAFLATSGGALMSFRTFNLVSPFIFVGGCAAAATLCLSSIVGLRTKVSRDVATISAINVRLDVGPLITMLVATTCLGTLLTYAVVERLG